MLYLKNSLAEFAGEFFYRIGNCVPIRQKNDLIALAIFSCLRHENANGHEQSDITSSYRPIQI